jgi:tRNA U34 5-methylaminomethyl-2-thiouridine-forming methyltransferase MnmC
MPQITVKTTITTAFDIPEGLTIDQIRHQTYPELLEAEDQVEEIVMLHSKVLNQVYIGDATERSQSIGHLIMEGVKHTD